VLEPKNNPFAELDLLFQNRISARKFAQAQIYVAKIAAKAV
jgi:hypothetical protein